MGERSPVRVDGWCVAGDEHRHGCSSPSPRPSPTPRARCPVRSGGGVPSSTMRTGPVHEVDAVVRAGEAERLGEAAGPGTRSRSRRAFGRRARITSSPSTGAPARSSTACGVARRAGDDVGAPVHPVREVHVQVAGRAEHRGVARRRPAVARGSPGRHAPGTPRPRRCAPRARPAPGSSCTSTLLSSSRRDVEDVALVERRGSVRRAHAHRPRSARRRVGRASQLGRDGLGTAARRASCAARTGRPGLEQRERVGAEARLGHHQLVERHAPLDRLPHERRRRPRAPRGTACPRATSHSARSVRPPTAGRRPPRASRRRRTSAVAEQARRARASASRARSRACRTAAPCPPAGHGCTRAAGP